MQRAQRALISLTDKSGCEPFAAALTALGIDILSTGGTASMLRAAGVTLRHYEHTNREVKLSL